MRGVLGNRTATQEDLLVSGPFFAPSLNLNTDVYELGTFGVEDQSFTVTIDPITSEGPFLHEMFPSDRQQSGIKPQESIQTKSNDCGHWDTSIEQRKSLHDQGYHMNGGRS